VIVSIIHVAATWAMVGFIWTIQVLHYPLMARVPDAEFPPFERSHQARVSVVLALFGPVEVVTAAWLFIDPGPIPRVLPLAAGLVLAAIWIATGFVFAPLHGRLAAGERSAHRRLEAWNWYRTGAWSIRGVMALWMLTF
jgi:hypothetical protein